MQWCELCDVCFAYYLLNHAFFADASYFYTTYCCCNTANSPTVGLIKDYLVYLWADELTCWKMSTFSKRLHAKMHDRSEGKTISSSPVNNKVLWQHGVVVTKWIMCWPTHCWQKISKLLHEKLPHTHTILSGVWEHTVSPLCNCLNKADSKFP